MTLRPFSESGSCALVPRGYGVICREEFCGGVEKGPSEIDMVENACVCASESGIFYSVAEFNEIFAGTAAESPGKGQVFAEDADFADCAPDGEKSFFAFPFFFTDDLFGGEIVNAPVKPEFFSLEFAGGSDVAESGCDEKSSSEISQPFRRIVFKKGGMAESAWRKPGQGFPLKTGVSDIHPAVNENAEEESASVIDFDCAHSAFGSVIKHDFPDSAKLLCAPDFFPECAGQGDTSIPFV